MKKFTVSLLAFLGLWLAIWQVAIRWPSSPSIPSTARTQVPDIGHIEIAPRSEALTFARFKNGDDTHLLLVTGFAAGKVSGIDIQAQLPGSASDPISVFNQTGYSPLEALIGTPISIATNDLVLPFSGTENQIAVGINYPAHAEETAVVNSFVFPKRTVATTHLASVPARDHLLDYEIELGFVLLNDLGRDELPKFMGLVLSSDYTDRAALIRHANLRDVSSGDGFTRGKSEPGFMPTGNLFVIIELAKWAPSSMNTQP